MAASFDDLEYEWLLLQRHSVLRQGTKGAHGLTTSGYVLLRCLEANGPMTLGELSKAFGLDTSTVNRQCGALMREGLLERIAGDGQSAARPIQPTALGRRKLKAERNEKLEKIESLLEGWPSKKLKEVTQALRDLNEEIERRQGVLFSRD